MEKHRQNRACSVCHAPMDPLGFALENFDAIGRWRSRADGRTPSTPLRCFPMAPRSRVPQDFAAVLLRSPERLAFAVAERMLTYALGRGWSTYDGPAVRHIVRQGRTRRLSLVVLGSGDRQERAFSDENGGSGEDCGKYREGEKTMMIFKKAIPRRTFLRGIGAAVALPAAGRHDPGVRQRGSRNR